MAKKASDKKEVTRLLMDEMFLDFNGVTVGQSFVVEADDEGRPVFLLGHPQGELVKILRKGAAFACFTAFADLVKGRYDVVEEFKHVVAYDHNSNGLITNVATIYNKRRSRWERWDFNGLTKKLQFGAFATPAMAAKHDAVRRFVLGQRIAIPQYLQTAGNKWDSSIEYGSFFLNLMTLTKEEAVKASEDALEQSATLRQAFAAGREGHRDEKKGKEVEKPVSLVFEMVTVSESLEITSVGKIDLMKLPKEAGRITLNLINNGKRWNQGRFSPESAFDVQSFAVYQKKGIAIEVVKLPQQMIDLIKA